MLQRGLYTLKSALWTLKRALHTLRIALHTLKRALHTLKRVMDMLYRALHTLKSAPRTYIHTTSLYAASFEIIYGSCQHTLITTCECTGFLYATHWSVRKVRLRVCNARFRFFFFLSTPRLPHAMTQGFIHNFVWVWMVFCWFFYAARLSVYGFPLVFIHGSCMGSCWFSYIIRLSVYSFPFEFIQGSFGRI